MSGTKALYCSFKSMSSFPGLEDVLAVIGVRRWVKSALVCISAFFVVEEPSVEAISIVVLGAISFHSLSRLELALWRG